MIRLENILWIGLTLLGLLHLTVGQTPNCNQAFIFERSRFNCRAYRIRICYSNTIVSMTPCGENAVFSMRARTCVPEGHQYDDCPKQQQQQPQGVLLSGDIPLTTEQRCKYGYGPTFAHPTKCGMFYNCAKYYKEIPDGYEQYLDECEYPQLYNERTRQCEPFQNVRCGARKEPKSPCDYVKNQCHTAHCMPCNLRFPSCSDKMDGFNTWPEREWTPYYTECRNGRLVNSGQCSKDQDFPMLFSPESRRCVSIQNVPVQFDGSQPECKGQDDGHYRDPIKGCDYFYICTNGLIEGTFQCPSGSVFDDHAKRCMDPRNVCGECGKETDC